jgi:DNA repair photolyase
MLANSKNLKFASHELSEKLTKDVLKLELHEQQNSCKLATKSDLISTHVK